MNHRSFVSIFLSFLIFRLSIVSSSASKNLASSYTSSASPYGRGHLGLLAKAIANYNQHANYESTVDEISLQDGKVCLIEPVKFKCIRDSLNIEERDFRSSLSLLSNSVIDSSSKSNQHFQLTQDKKYILKTIKEHEYKLLVAMLDRYIQHICSKEGTCLIPVLGLYKVELPRTNMYNTRNIAYCMVSSNIFSDSFDRDRNQNSKWKFHRFDLKGSMIGRAARKNSLLGKDQDILTSNVSFGLSNAQLRSLLEIIRRDASFLESFDLMDYSMLLSVVENDPKLDNKVVHKKKISLWDIIFLSSSRKSSFISQEPTANMRIADCGICTITTSEGCTIKFGIVDYLQRYTLRKQLETFIKSTIYDGRYISCVDPKYYCERFVQFFTKILVSVTGKKGVGIPVILLHDAEGGIVTVEMKDGSIYRGTLEDAQDNMNLTLTMCIKTDKDGVLSNVEMAYIRGSQIQYVVLPDMLGKAPYFNRIKMWRKFKGHAVYGAGGLIGPRGQSAAIIQKSVTRRLQVQGGAGIPVSGAAGSLHHGGR